MSLIIPKALEYYDKNKIKYNSLFSKIKNNKEQIEFIEKKKDTEKNEIIIYDENNKKIAKAKYELIGVYYSIHQLWVWAWALQKVYKNKIYTSRKLLNYGLDIDSFKYDLLKTQLTTSRFKITNLLQLDINIAISSYLTKIPTIYSHKIYISENNYTTYYMFLFDLQIIK
jgi:hypothetical protein